MQSELTTQCFQLNIWNAIWTCRSCSYSETHTSLDLYADQSAFACRHVCRQVCETCLDTSLQCITALRHLSASQTLFGVRVTCEKFWLLTPGQTPSSEIRALLKNKDTAKNCLKHQPYSDTQRLCTSHHISSFSLSHAGSGTLCQSCDRVSIISLQTDSFVPEFVLER